MFSAQACGRAGKVQNRFDEGMCATVIHSGSAGIGHQGVDCAKQGFQRHEATAEGDVLCKKLARKTVSCGYADLALRQDARRIAPKVVNPPVQILKNGMADADAIAKAARRPTMRGVDGKTPEQQGVGIFCRRGPLAGQRTQTLCVWRGWLSGSGVVAAKGRETIDKLRSALDKEKHAADFPASVSRSVALAGNSVCAPWEQSPIARTQWPGA